MNTETTDPYGGYLTKALENLSMPSLDVFIKTIAGMEDAQRDVYLSSLKTRHYDDPKLGKFILTLVSNQIGYHRHGEGKG